MTTTVHATFDGEVLRLEEPVHLEPNTRVLVTIQSPDQAESEPASFLDTALALKLQGPPDWASRLEDYLYGDKTLDHE